MLLRIHMHPGREEQRLQEAETKATHETQSGQIVGSNVMQKESLVNVVK